MGGVVLPFLDGKWSAVQNSWLEGFPILIFWLDFIAPVWVQRQGARGPEEVEPRIILLPLRKDNFDTVVVFFVDRGLNIEFGDHQSGDQYNQTPAKQFSHVCYIPVAKS